MTSASRTAAWGGLYAPAMRTLYGRSATEVRADLDAGIACAVAQLGELRITQPGALDRCDRLAEQFDGLRLGVLRLRSAILRESCPPPKAA